MKCWQQYRKWTKKDAKLVWVKVHLKWLIGGYSVHVYERGYASALRLILRLWICLVNLVSHPSLYIQSLCFPIYSVVDGCVLYQWFSERPNITAAATWLQHLAWFSYLWLLHQALSAEPDLVGSFVDHGARGDFAELSILTFSVPVIGLNKVWLRASLLPFIFGAEQQTLRFTLLCHLCEGRDKLSSSRLRWHARTGGLTSGGRRLLSKSFINFSNFHKDELWYGSHRQHQILIILIFILGAVEFTWANFFEATEALNHLELGGFTDLSDRLDWLGLNNLMKIVQVLLCSIQLVILILQNSACCVLRLSSAQSEIILDSCQYCWINVARTRFSSFGCW